MITYGRREDIIRKNAPGDLLVGRLLPEEGGEGENHGKGGGGGGDFK